MADELPEAAVEIGLILRGDLPAQARMKQYDAAFAIAQITMKQPWLLCINQWGWSPYMCYLNQELNPPLPYQYRFPSPDTLIKIIGGN